jgi:hypothetical protein
MSENIESFNDLAYELKMIRFEKEDKLIKELDEYSYSPENMNTVIPPMILPYMWESERFSENFTDLFLNKLKILDTTISEIEKMGNIFSTIANYTSYATVNDVNEREMLERYKNSRQYILRYIEDKAPEHIWLLFKLREK